MLSLRYLLETFYFSQALDGKILQFAEGANSCYHKEKILKQRKKINAYLHRYWTSIARVIFDYLTIASLGEARRYSRLSPLFLIDPNKRTDHLSELHATTRAAFTNTLRGSSAELDPVSILKACELIFSNTFVDSPGAGLGGKNWAQIAHGALRYFSLSPEIFLDHVFSLQHNNGTAFSKIDYEIIDPSHDPGFFTYQAENDLLDKRDVVVSTYYEWRNTSKLISKTPTGTAFPVYIQRLYSFLQPQINFYNSFTSLPFNFEAFAWSTLSIPTPIIYGNRKLKIYFDSSKVNNLFSTATAQSLRLRNFLKFQTHTDIFLVSQANQAILPLTIHQ